MAAKPLAGVRILDLSRMIAGGLTSMLFADFGADVVKLEQPGTGDPLRKWTTRGLPLWWSVYARGKRYITLNLQSPEGKELLLRLIPRFDVVIESFMPGTMERWGLDWETLHAVHRGLIMLRISGWGRAGPGADRPGFGTLVEAGSGFAAMTGEPDGAPVLPSFPMADMTSGLYGANAVMFALYHRDVNGGEGQSIDLSLFESLFSLLGPQPAEYAALGKVRERQGNRSTNAGPRGCYRTMDGQWIAVSGSTPKMAERFLESFGLSELLDDPRFTNNEARVAHSTELDAEIRRAIGSRTMAENLAIIRTNKLTAHPVQTIADIENDDHWKALNLTVEVGVNGRAVRMHNVIPRLSETPGEIRWPGGDLGQHNHEIFCDELDLSAEEFSRFQAGGVI